MKDLDNKYQQCHEEQDTAWDCTKRCSDMITALAPLGAHVKHGQSREQTNVKVRAGSSDPLLITVRISTNRLARTIRKNTHGNMLV